MSLQVVNINELDGALGALPEGSRPLAIVGASTAGPLNTPAAFGRTKDVSTTFGRGPLVQAAARWIQQAQRPCLLVRTGNSVAGTPGTIDVTGKAGTSSVTNGTSVPDDGYEPYLKVLVGGTIGVAGITYQDSLDNGRTLSAVKALGTANTLTLEGYTGGTGTFLFGAGTLVAGDVIKRRDAAPNWNASELGTALTALKNSAVLWDIVEIVGDVDATAFDTISAAFSTGEKCWIGGARMPNVAESEAAYLTALNTIFSAKTSTFGALCAGAANISSGSDFRSYRRPVAVAIAAAVAKVSEEIDISQPISLYALAGVGVRDANGNALEHDEFINPGLDDSRFTVLRTWDGIAGVYCNNPRLFSALGSDFEFIQHRRVMNLAKAALRIYFTARLSKPVQVSASTGFILPAEADEIDAGADAAVRAVLMDRPKASGGGLEKGRFAKISRTDNLLSTKTMTVQGSVIPLAYPKAVNIDIGFRNPALQLVPVS